MFIFDFHTNLNSTLIIIKLLGVFVLNLSRHNFIIQCPNFFFLDLLPLYP